jgi:ABC-type transport system involved in multi-copper enzyme maturation permease subunit
VNVAIAIAGNTVREALRERLMYNLVVFALVLIVGALNISQLTLGEQFRIISNVGTASAQVFGTLIAVFVGVGLVSKEIDRRTCYPLLARPISRSAFVLGKYAGLIAVLALNTIVMMTVNGATLAAYAGNARFAGMSFFGCFSLLLVQFMVCAAFAVFFSSFTTATLATIFTLSVVAAGHVFSEVRGFWLGSAQVKLKPLIHVLDVLLPNMGLLDLKEAFTYGDAVTASSLALRSLYGLGYASAVVALACIVFSRRDMR